MNLRNKLKFIKAWKNNVKWYKYNCISLVHNIKTNKIYVNLFAVKTSCLFYIYYDVCYHNKITFSDMGIFSCGARDHADTVANLFVIQANLSDVNPVI